MTRSEFNAICVACGLLLLGYGADSFAHWRSRQPSDRYVRSDSIFFALARASTTAVIAGVVLDHDSTMVPHSEGNGSSSSKSLDDGRLDLNTATHAQLVDLPGIGPALATRIIEYRRQRGPFASVADLQRVTGIGPAKTSRIASLVVAKDSTIGAVPQR